RSTARLRVGWPSGQARNPRPGRGNPCTRARQLLVRGIGANHDVVLIVTVFAGELIKVEGLSCRQQESVSALGLIHRLRPVAAPSHGNLPARRRGSIDAGV